MCQRTLTTLDDSRITRDSAMQTDLVRGIEEAYAQRADPVVFALTGRTGSGCTTAGLSLSKSFNEIALQDGQHASVETRKLGIAIEYAKSHWVPFSVVTVSSVIFCSILQENW